MKNQLTELVFILDKSGSMAKLAKDTIGGFNSLIDKQRKEEGECYVSTVLFDNTSQVIHDRVELSHVRPMQAKDYVPYGSTALIDAIGGAVHHIRNVHRYARKEDVPAHTLFIIMTDGMENASHHYTSDAVKKMIQIQKEKFGWEFLFIGANIDSVETAARFGIDRERAVDYHADQKGTETVYETLSSAIRSVRQDMAMEASWSDEIRKDYEKRKAGKHTPEHP